MNINDNVWVRLTPDGERLWAKSWEEMLRYFPGDYWIDGVPKSIRSAHTESDGRVRFQLWELMNIFGPVCFNGSPVHPFEGNRVDFAIC